MSLKSSIRQIKLTRLKNWLKYSVQGAYNKLFKRDSQRVAFSLCVGISDYGGMRSLRYCVAHPLTRRYTFGAI
ncbi:DUF3265 domain-containing protein [Vibrio sp. ED002]|nr:DUF3265 domain-containing protein [Vibrio sp. ED002]